MGEGYICQHLAKFGREMTSERVVLSPNHSQTRQLRQTEKVAGDIVVGEVEHL